MTTVPTGEPEHAELFQRERPRLLAVAFRILGSDADAHDVVQEAWFRYAGSDTSDVRNLPAWLTTIVTRLCIDLLRRRREYPSRPDQLPGAPADAAEPEELALLAGELTAAWTVVLDRLTPPQRVALVLHDVFAVPFDDIARVLDTTASSAKKLASRARGRVRQAVGPDQETARAGAGPSPGTVGSTRSSSPPSGSATDPAEARDVVQAFLRASRHGDLDGLVRLLDPNVVRTADPSVLPPGTSMELRGASAVVEETRTLAAHVRRARLATVDGAPGIVVDAPAGGPYAVLTFRILAGRIARYDVIADPRRLALLRIEA